MSSRRSRPTWRCKRASVTPASSPRDAVLALLSAMRSPAHVAALSVAYKQKTGRAMKQDHKRGGMLAFLKTELKEEVIVVGTGNDSFVSLATPTAKAVHWLRECVRDNGPVLISMIGRLYHEVSPPPLLACPAALLSPHAAPPLTPRAASPAATRGSHPPPSPRRPA